MRRLLLGLVVAVATLVPNIAKADDQMIAREIMSKLQLEQQRGALKGFHVDMRVDQGTVWYKGFVSSQDQKDLILRTAQQAQNLGVVQVVDDITVQAAEPTAGSEAQQMAFYQEDQATPAIQQVPGPQPRMNIPSPTINQPIASNSGAFISQQQQPIAANRQQQPMAANAVGMEGPPMAMNTGMQMPVAGDAAALPAYAWPSYAAHPNYAAVTYPGQYSASAWPYIGPFYPYPQVPLGWRKSPWNGTMDGGGWISTTTRASRS